MVYMDAYELVLSFMGRPGERNLFLQQVPTQSLSSLVG